MTVTGKSDLDKAILDALGNHASELMEREITRAKERIELALREAIGGVVLQVFNNVRFDLQEHHLVIRVDINRPNV